MKIRKQVLKKVQEEAIRMGEQGILVWPNWNMYNYQSEEILRKGEQYELAMKSIIEKKNSTLKWKLMGVLELPGIFVIPTELIILTEVISGCENMEGPITFLPSNRLSSLFD